MKTQLTHLITFSVLLTMAFAKRFKKADTLTNEEMQDAAQGALRLGTNTPILVPDSSSEHPLILSNAEDQPLCSPSQTIEPSSQLQVMPGYEIFVLTNQIVNPKKLIMDKSGHLLVISGNKGVYSVRTDKCGNADVQLIVDSESLPEPLGNGIDVYGQHLYLTTSKSVYQFPYSDGQHAPLKNGIKVMSNINPADSAQPPDIAIDIFGHAYIPRTVDEINPQLDSSHAIIKKFDFRLIPERSYDYLTDGEVFSYGTNIQGLMGFDAQAKLWGIDGLTRHSNNDATQVSTLNGFAEELNKFNTPAVNYGFPYCLTEHHLNPVSKGLGSQWGHPVMANSSLSLEDYCQDASKNTPPTVPLLNQHATNVHFYTGVFCSVGNLITDGTSVGLPCNWTNTPIIANHGQDGYPGGHNVVHLPFNDLGHQPRLDKKPEVLLSSSCEEEDEKCFSPFGLAHDDYGRLYVSSDLTDEIIVFRRTFSEHAAQKMTDLVDAYPDSLLENDKKNYDNEEVPVKEDEDKSEEEEEGE